MSRGRTARRLGGLAGLMVVGVVVALASAVLGAAPASAAAYRYWVYWHGTASGGWTFSPVGGTYRPPDGAVEGWRFGVSAEAGTLKPRAAASFATICAGRTAGAGDKLVALVVDYGTTADAPPGESPPRGVDTFCADVPATTNAVGVLGAYSSVRTDAGLVCGIRGYPAQECGVAVQPTTHPTAPPTTHPTGQPTSRPTAQPATRTGGTSTLPTATAGSRSANAGPSAAAPSTAAPSSGPATDASSPTAVAVGAGGLDGGGPGAPAGSPGPSGTPVGALVGAALVLGVGGAAVWRAARGAGGAAGRGART